MRYNYHFTTLFLTVGFFSALISASSAHYVAPPPTLPEVVDQAEVIAIGRLVEYNQPGPKKDTAGVYVFQSLKILKAPTDAPGFFNVELPPVEGVQNAALNFKRNNRQPFLLFLTKKRDNNFSPVDVVVSYVRLSDQYVNLADNKTFAQALPGVVSVLIESLPDPNVRRLNTYLLKSVIDNELPRLLRPYLSDSDLEVQDNVLSCYIANQQVDAIPQVASLTDKTWHQSQSVPEALTQLDQYRSVNAVPYLNPLLFDRISFVRINAMNALLHLANHRSVPYLMIALNDPDEFTSFEAYGQLHHLIPALGPPDDYNYFQTHHDAELQPLDDWWHDEMLGKHSHAISLLKDKTTASLNASLFYPDVAVRRQSIKKLLAKSDQSSVPYLVLALRDPDAVVALDASKILTQLNPEANKARSQKNDNPHASGTRQRWEEWWKDQHLQSST